MIRMETNFNGIKSIFLHTDFGKKLRVWRQGKRAPLIGELQLRSTDHNGQLHQIVLRGVSLRGPITITRSDDNHSWQLTTRYLSSQRKVKQVSQGEQGE